MGELTDNKEFYRSRILARREQMRESGNNHRPDPLFESEVNIVDMPADPDVQDAFWQDTEGEVLREAGASYATNLPRPTYGGHQQKYLQE